MSVGVMNIVLNTWCVTYKHWRVRGREKGWWSWASAGSLYGGGHAIKKLAGVERVNSITSLNGKKVQRIDLLVTPVWWSKPGLGSTEK